MVRSGGTTTGIGGGRSKGASNLGGGIGANLGGGIGGEGDKTRGTREATRQFNLTANLSPGQKRGNELRQIAQSLNLLPTNLFAFSPVKDQVRFIGELAGQGLQPGQVQTTEGGVTIPDAGQALAPEAAPEGAGGEILPSGLTREEALKQSTEAFNQPFKDPVGFLRDTFSSEGLSQTLPLALGEAGAFRALGQILSNTFAKFTTYTPRAGVAATTTRVVADNAKNYGLKASYLTRLASAATKPQAVLALLTGGFFTSLFWAPNEKGDALTTLTIAQRDAANNNDRQAVLEIDDLIQETLNISASVPVIGFLEAEKAKFVAAAKASETISKRFK